MHPISYHHYQLKKCIVILTFSHDYILLLKQSGQTTLYGVCATIAQDRGAVTSLNMRKLPRLCDLVVRGLSKGPASCMAPMLQFTVLHGKAFS